MIVDISNERIEFINIEILEIEREMSEHRDKTTQDYANLLDAYEALMHIRYSLMKDL